MARPKGQEEILEKVYSAILGVMSDLSKEGITKDRRNAQQGYQFRGIDDVLNALSPLLVKNKLVILPRCLTRSVEEAETKSGARMCYVTVHVEYYFVSSEDASRVTISTFGEAMDTADKATNKAMSAAYKYAAFQAFCIPTEGEDADAVTPEVKPIVKKDKPSSKQTTPQEPAADPRKEEAAEFLKSLGLTVTEMKSWGAMCDSRGIDKVEAALLGKAARATDYTDMVEILGAVGSSE